MQNSRIPQGEPLVMEKLIAALSYITSGFVGLLWLVVGVVTKSSTRPFLKYHIFQSIFISILFFLVGAFLGLIMNILSIIPGLNQLVLQFTFYLNAPILMDFSLIQSVMFGLIVYLVFTTFQGQYSYLPWVSDIIKQNVR